MDYNERIKILQDSKKSVFSASDLRKLWGMDQVWFRTVVKRMVDNGILHRISAGYYLFGFKLDPLELANAIVRPSYISFDSALKYFDINFQEKKTIFSVASISYKRNIGGYTFEYRKIKDDILFNLRGINYFSNITIAVPERAVLDGIYHNFLLNIDREDNLNKGYLLRLSTIYPKFVQIKAKKLYDKKRN